jgi:hypothetical protein
MPVRAEGRAGTQRKNLASAMVAGLKGSCLLAYWIRKNAAGVRYGRKKILSVHRLTPLGNR